MGTVRFLWVWIYAGCIGVIRATDCPNTWVAFEGSCYHFETDTPLKFVEAEHFCRQHNAHLVHVDSGDENLFLKAFLRDNKHNPSWIGLTDSVIEGRWVWYDDDTKVGFTDWGPGEPNNANQGQDCAALDKYWDYKWDDFPCDALLQPLCEIRRGESAIVG